MNEFVLQQLEKAYKIDSKTREVLNSWSSIAKAALSEEFSSAK